jgi:hypothetical protein
MNENCCYHQRGHRRIVVTQPSANRPLETKELWQMTYELVLRAAAISSAMNRRPESSMSRRLGARSPAPWWRRRFRVARRLPLRKTLLKLPLPSISGTACVRAARFRLAVIRPCLRRALISTSGKQPQSITKNGGTRRRGHIRPRESNSRCLTGCHFLRKEPAGGRRHEKRRSNETDDGARGRECQQCQKLHLTWDDSPRSHVNARS